MMTKLFYLPFLLLSFFVAVTISTAQAADPIYTGTFSNTAVGGYDVVSYFQGDGVPVKGDKQFKTSWSGANWHFQSQENLDLFVNNPTQYAPQYGGYCAWAMANGQIAKGDPKIYHIHEGKLYLNYNAKVKTRWLADIPGFIKDADQNFPQIVGAK